ncbi:uncharacterized protein LOC108744739 isoform X2 [Agrilus planipennis]|nr:uncharacterized protein LOC108744739 isoform X2 [Agrilus planipennis]
MVITNSQEEFNKRRKIRLEQVRQQSKDIAHNVRKRIAKENNKQASSSEQHNLRKWQAQKLLEFEQKYQECLSSLEVPPKISTEISEEILAAERKRKNRAVALERGERANEKLQIEKNEKSMQKSVPIQQKKFAREIENSRSLAITNFTKRKKSKSKNDEKEIKNTFYLDLPNDSEQSGHQEKEIQCTDEIEEMYQEDMKNKSGTSSSELIDSSSSSTEIPSKKIKTSNESKQTSKIKVFQAMVHNEPSPKKKGKKVSISSELSNKKQKDKSKDDESDIPKKLEIRDENLNMKKSTGRQKLSVRISDQSPVSSPKKVVLYTLPEKLVTPAQQAFSTKTDFKRNPMRNKLFSGVESEKVAVENVTSKSRLEGACKLQDSLSPDSPRSPMITHSERLPELKQQFILDKRISEHIMSRKLNEEKRRDRDIQVKDDKKNALVQSDLNQGQFQTCLCSCYGFNENKMVSESVYCNYPETLSEEVQTCTTIDRSCFTNQPKVRSTSTSQEVNECTQVNHRDICQHCNFPKADVKVISNSEECSSSSRVEIKSTKTSSNSSKLTSCKDVTSSAKSMQVPKRPSVSLSKPIKGISRTLKPETTEKVQIYDDATKYSSSYAPSNNLVQKIPINNLSIVIESSEDESSRREKNKDDKYAEIRGYNALKKEKICRDYEEIMCKLPFLQKKERIASIGKDDPKYHMSEERRKEYEKRKENTIETAYENCFPKAVTITLPKRVSAADEDKLPYKIIDMRNGPTGINLGTWDVNKKDSSAPENVCSYTQTVKHPEQSPTPIENDENMLRNLLEKLIDQKEKLDKEVSRVPEGSRLHQILNDLECGFYNKKEQTKQELESDHKKLQQNESCSKPAKLTLDHENVNSQELKVHNTSTQTSPRSKQLTELPSTFACPCIVEHKKKDSCEKLCEIVIKVGEEANQPKIQITPTSNDEKGVVFTVKDLMENQSNKACDLNKPKNMQKSEDATVRVTSKKLKTDLYAAVTEPQKIEKSSPVSKKISSSQDKKSWKDVLTQNSTNCTSSTSYVSPPNFTSSVTKYIKDKRENSSGMYNILCRKPQQGNLNYHLLESENTLLKDKRSNPELLNHIKHLLRMSHTSIEELNVSSVSSVSTPDSTLFAGEKNKTISQLRSICKQYNLRKKDLEKMFSVLSSSSSNGGCESTSSSYKSASNNCIKLKRSAENETEKLPCGTSDSLQKLYEEMTVKCMEKIESLSVLIENLREEKNKIISCQEQSDNGDVEDSSTKYLEIEKKSPVLECDNSDKTKTDSSEFVTSSQGGEDSLTKKLLEIDEALTERIKNLSKLEKSCTTDDAQPQNQYKSADSSEEVDNSIEKELIYRYKNLVYDHEKCEDKTQSETKPNFVPFVSDISCLPKWEGLGPYTSHTDEMPNKCTAKPNKPPPSRGLLNAKRFNDEILNYPHELSSITEVDSFTSSRIRRSTSPKRNSPKHTVEFAPDYNCEQNKNTECNDVSFPRLNSNFEELKLLQRQKIVSQICPSASVIEQEVVPQKCTRSACSSPKKIVIDRLIHSEQNSPKKMCSRPQELYQKGGEVLKRARELTTRIQNLSKSFELRPCSPPCDNQEQNIKTCEGLIEEVQSKPKRKVVIEENSSSGSNESATDVESVEKMLKSLGMGWAVATLRKTQQALALTSSSSSVDLKVEREVKITDKNSSSEISLIECIEQRRHVGDLHSSNETNNDTSLHKYLQNVSSIPASNSTFGRSTQRTSTPVNKNDTTIPASNLIYSGESDLSSVRHSSENKSSNFNRCVTNEKRSKR